MFLGQGLVYSRFLRYGFHVAGALATLPDSSMSLASSGFVLCSV